MNPDIGYAQIKLRMPADEKSRLQEEAAQNGRSLSKEILHRLRMDRTEKSAEEGGASTAPASETR